MPNVKSAKKRLAKERHSFFSVLFALFACIPWLFSVIQSGVEGAVKEENSATFNNANRKEREQTASKGNAKTKVFTPIKIPLNGYTSY